MTDKLAQPLDNKSFDLRVELQKYARKWYWFVLGIIICVFLASVYLRYSTPQYEIFAELLIRDNKKGAGDVAGSGSIALSDLNLLNQSQSIYNEIEVLSSRSLLKRVFNSMPQLQTSIILEGRIKTSEAYGKEAPIIVKVASLDSTVTLMKEPVEILVKDVSSFYLSDKFGKTLYRYGQPITRPYGSFMVLLNPFSQIPDNYHLYFYYSFIIWMNMLMCITKQ
ncbi:MAG: Wzz/FepE/Etk N-terminal domain-containing protein [Arachidicoccus sp.]|nr:Wzz/FepE/Etk N-terminal domain-containing protein [Arachidicoccus sp.]